MSSILIVEDENELANIIKENLTQEGFTDCEIANNGQDAYNACIKRLNDKKPFHLIISDWDMPVMNGIQLLEKVRKNTLMEEIPFILITGVGSAETVRMASRLGVSAIILKPFDRKVLVEKVQNLLGKAEPKASEA